MAVIVGSIGSAASSVELLSDIGPTSDTELLVASSDQWNNGRHSVRCWLYPVLLFGNSTWDYCVIVFEALFSDAIFCC